MTFFIWAIFLVEPAPDIVLAWFLKQGWTVGPAGTDNKVTNTNGYTHNIQVKIEIPGEWTVAQIGNQFHAFLEERRISHLFYLVREGFSIRWDTGRVFEDLGKESTPKTEWDHLKDDQA